LGETMMQYSVSGLGRTRQGSDRRDELVGARDLARDADALGYTRFGFAEHRIMRSVTPSATSVVLAYVAGATSRIRVDSGGILLPNHSPYVIAEQFGTLATLFPGRIDLGLRRAPGTDQLTLRALRLTPAEDRKS